MLQQANRCTGARAIYAILKGYRPYSGTANNAYVYNRSGKLVMNPNAALAVSQFKPNYRGIINNLITVGLTAIPIFAEAVILEEAGAGAAHIADILVAATEPAKGANDADKDMMDAENNSKE